MNNTTCFFVLPGRFQPQRNADEVEKNRNARYPNPIFSPILRVHPGPPPPSHPLVFIASRRRKQKKSVIVSRAPSY